MKRVMWPENQAQRLAMTHDRAVGGACVGVEAGLDVWGGGVLVFFL